MFDLTIDLILHCEQGRIMGRAGYPGTEIRFSCTYVQATKILVKYAKKPKLFLWNEGDFNILVT